MVVRAPIFPAFGILSCCFCRREAFSWGSCDVMRGNYWSSQSSRLIAEMTELLFLVARSDTKPRCDAACGVKNRERGNDVKSKIIVLLMITASKLTMKNLGCPFMNWSDVRTTDGYTFLLCLEAASPRQWILKAFNAGGLTHP